MSEPSGAEPPLDEERRPPRREGPAQGTGTFEVAERLDERGIVGARWWHRSLIDEDARVQRRSFLTGLAVLGGGGALMAGSCVLSSVGRVVVGGISDAMSESTSIALRPSLDMQRAYGWDFGARGVPLVFDGVAEGPFVRSALDALATVLAPRPHGPNAKYHVGTLVASLAAVPTLTLPDPQDGQPRPDGAPFKRLADVLLPISTPAMTRAYGVGEALARLAGPRSGIAVLVDLPGPEAVAFAAGAASRFEPVLLLDNWPHPRGVVASHLALAALAYYQPRFASQAQRIATGPLFVLDRARLSPYSEETDRFDNRYLAQMPSLEALAKDGIRALFYVVATPAALPAPDDLAVLAARTPAVPFEARAVALSDFVEDAVTPGSFRYAGAPQRTDDAFWADYPLGRPSPEAPPPASTATKDHRFTPRAGAVGATSVPAARVGQVAVVVAASGLILAAALDRQGSRNRFSGGWGG